MNLPQKLHSHGLRRLAAVEAARGSFDATAEGIERNTGTRLAKRQAEELVERAAQDFDAFYDRPESAEAADITGARWSVRAAEAPSSVCALSAPAGTSTTTGASISTLSTYGTMPLVTPASPRSASSPAERRQERAAPGSERQQQASTSIRRI